MRAYSVRIRDENGFANKAITQHVVADRQGGQMNIMSILSGPHLRINTSPHSRSHWTVIYFQKVPNPHSSGIILCSGLFFAWMSSLGDMWSRFPLLHSHICGNTGNKSICITKQQSMALCQGHFRRFQIFFSFRGPPYTTNCVLTYLWHTPVVNADKFDNFLYDNHKSVLVTTVLTTRWQPCVLCVLTSQR